ncbi:TetR/AcrR family transcriptional regulator [Rhizobium indigoferae]|uniref:TetR/AcrR family transcriptional regulator n=1 Tax=Rhizobium indigoferae TaxID=158891 RepID=A0ABZ1DSJ0_9HYPH|nr:TetR/AcrR family transcriptional regulator [Rhizobium indigoferae]NNU55861.1 TetR/AcrR family transcriptional regulator [Rhizobium indigoferae]WRW39190.1 TetR/AcrR family transcriptional regulator [Rhizobium indigoferae]GLR57453.1 TetR family transcriptional regulator [Rhizobium indigoferae]
MAKNTANSPASGTNVRDRILATASELFYRRGVRAVGVDLVVEKSGVAKTSLYRHFGTKDDLIAAFLKREDLDFWNTWDRVREQHPEDAPAELDAHFEWIGERVGRDNYRGCPQINTAAEFPEADHPARKVAEAHMRELRRRLKTIAEGLAVAAPDRLAGQLTVLINGAFVSMQVFERGEATSLLRDAAHALIAASRS